MRAPCSRWRGGVRRTWQSAWPSAGCPVRETEKTVQTILNPKPKKSNRLKASRDVLRFEEELSEKFGTKVEIKPGKKGAGKLVISYASHEHLDDLLSKFKG